MLRGRFTRTATVVAFWGRCGLAARLIGLQLRRIGQFGPAAVHFNPPLVHVRTVPGQLYEVGDN